MNNSPAKTDEKKSPMDDVLKRMLNTPPAPKEKEKKPKPSSASERQAGN